MIKGKFTDDEMAIFQTLEAKKEAIQSEIDPIDAQLNDESKTLGEIKQLRSTIREKRDLLVPIAQLQAALASPLSRDKYFPDMSKNQFLEYIKGQV